MATLAEASVAVVADTEQFDSSLRDGINRAAGSADRASQSLGSRIGSTISNSTGRALNNLRSTLSRSLDSTPLLRDFRAGFRGAATDVAGLRRAVDNFGRGTRGSLAPLSDAVNRFRDDVSGLNDVFARMSTRARLIFAAVRTGVQGLPALGSLVSTATASAFGAGLAGIGVAAAAQAQRVQDEFSGLADHVSGVLQDIAEPFEDTLVSIADEARSAFDGLTPSLERVFSSTAPAVDEFASRLLGAAEAFGPAFEESGQVFADVLGQLTQQAVPVIEDIAASLTELFASSDVDFFSSFVTGVLRLVDALIQAVTWLSNTFGVLQDQLGPALSALQPLASGFADGFTVAVDVIGSLLEQLRPLGDVLDSATGYLEDNEEALTVLGATLGAAVTALGAYRTAALLGTLATQTFAASTRGLSLAIRNIPLIGWALAGVSALIALYQTSQTFRDTVSDAWGVVQGAISTAWGAISGVFAAFSDAWSSLVDGLGESEVLVELWDRLSTSIQAFADIVGIAVDHMQDAWNLMVDLFSGDAGISDFVDFAESAFDRLGGVGDIIADTVTGHLDDLPQLALGALQGLGSTIAGFFRGLPGRVSDIMSGQGGDGGILGWLSDLPGRALDLLQELGPRVAGFFRGLPGRVSDIMSGQGGDGGILGWLSDLPDVALGLLQSLGSALIEFFQGLPGRVSDIMSGQGGDGGILGWLSDLPGRALEFVREVGPEIIDWLRGLPDLIRENIDPGAIVDWLREVPGRIIEFMQNYGPQILKGFAIAVGVVVLGIPALFLTILGAILTVLGTIAVELATWAWDAFTNMMSTAGRAFMAGINRIIQWFTALPGRIMAAIANFGMMLAEWGRGAITWLRNVLSRGMTALRTMWSTAWTRVVTLAQNVWNTLVNWVVGKATSLRDRVMGPVNTLRQRMVSAFEAARVGIESAWNRVRRVVGEPIEWVVNTAYNDWLRGVWSNVTEKFGGPTLPEYTVNLASGGVFPGYTPGRDVHAMPMAAFSGGESVLRPEITKAWGTKTTDMLNKLAKSGGVQAVRKALMMLFSGYNPFTGGSVARPSTTGAAGASQKFASGGILDRVGGTASRAASWLKSESQDFTEGMNDFLDDPGGMLRDMFKDIFDYTKMPHWGAGWTSLLKRIPQKMINRLVKKAKDLFSFDGDWTNIGGDIGSQLGAALAFAKSQAGKPYIWGGVGPRGYDCCIIPGVRIYGPNGVKKIEEMHSGDLVYAYVDGKLEAHPVTAVWQSKRQPVFAVRTRNRTVTASANHPFMRLVKSGDRTRLVDGDTWPGPVDMPRGSRGHVPCSLGRCERIAWSRCMCAVHYDRWKKHGDPRVHVTTGARYDVEWARLDELERGDLLVQPRSAPTRGSAAATLPDGTPVSPDVAWLIGAMVGDGTITDKGVRLCLYGQERDRANRIISEQWNCNPSYSADSGLVASCAQLRDALTELGMRKPGPEKTVPEVVWSWTQEAQRAFLDGYCDADGHRPVNPAKHGAATYHSASRELIEDVRALHISLGDPVSNISETKRANLTVIDGKEVRQALPQHSFTLWGANARTGEAALRQRPGLADWLDEGDFTLTKVLDITPKGEQDTWDMEIKDAHNFIADGVVVHNSGFISAIHNVILGKRPYSRRYTTHPFTGRSYGGFTKNFPSPFTIGVTHADVGHMAGTLLKTNVESRGSAGVVVGSRARGTNSGLFSRKYGLVGAGSTRNQPMGGEGILLDRGGVLPPGATLAVNKTGRPESVRTYAQEANISRLVQLMQRSVSLQRSPLVPADRAEGVAQALRRDGVEVGAGTTVNAPVTVTTYASDPETVAYKTAARISRLAGL